MRFQPVALALAALALPLSVAAQAAPEEDKQQADDDNKIRCKRMQVTGSLARKPKVCKTVAEWRELSEKGNRNARDIIESGQSCAGGPMCNGG